MTKKLAVNEKMRRIANAHPEFRGRTAEDWASSLGMDVGPTTVKATDTWKALQADRESRKPPKNDRRRKTTPQHRDD
jgi:hypothetical protein